MTDRRHKGRPPKYSWELKRSIMNYEKTDDEFAAELGLTRRRVQNLRSEWRTGKMVGAVPQSFDLVDTEEL